MMEKKQQSKKMFDTIVKNIRPMRRCEVMQRTTT